MQTFLPYPNFADSSEALDDKRLGKQRVETYQIANLLRKEKEGEDVKGWRNHPAVRMWRGYEYQLCNYGLANCEAWRRLGFNDTLLEKIGELQLHFDHCELPKWFGDKDFHISHQSNLLRKGREWVNKAEDNLAYIKATGSDKKIASAIKKLDKAIEIQHRYQSFFIGVPDNLPYIWPV